MTLLGAAHRGLLALVLVLAGSLFASPAGADRGGFIIRDFKTSLTVEETSELQVEERLAVEYLEPRHGIYRTIPIRYTDRRGFAYSMGFRLQEVVDQNGIRQPTRVTHQGRYVNIRIGDPDRMVNGHVTYTLRYRMTDALGNFPEHDELYWNATGHEWNTSIEHASAVIRLPAAWPPDSLETACYTGRFGEREGAARIGSPEPGVLTFEVEGSLAPLEGMTVVAAWPKGVVRFPSASTRLARAAADNWILLAPLLTLGLLMWIYSRYGRDPEGPAAVVVRYEPPQGVTAGEIGALVDEKVDLRDLTAVLIDLAVRGYLVIREDENATMLPFLKRKETVFERKREKSEEELLLHERLILKGVFESGDVVSSRDLKEEFYTHLPGIRNALYSQLTNRGYFAGDPKAVRTRYQVLGFLAGVGVGGLGMLWAHARGGIFPLAAAVPVAAGIGTFVVFLIMAPAMPKRTRRGVDMRAWASGFREFVHRVERPALEAQEARLAFESLLPYAMALGLSSVWARRFEGLYRSHPPTWYLGADPSRGFSTRDFEQNLSSSMRDVGRQMAASPRSSSGTGGGGFSGGGGGGGGGGSW